MSEWEKVGQCFVDAGILWLGDPGYILHRENPPKEIGVDWADFCTKLYHTPSEATQFGKGTGVVVSTGFGDGCYNVYVKRSNEGAWGNRIKEVKVVFIDDEDDTQEEDE